MASSHSSTHFSEYKEYDVTHVRQIDKLLSDTRCENWLVDTSLQVQSRIIGCHGVVIAAAIPSLKDRLEGLEAERNSDTLTHVDLTDEVKTPEVLDLIVEYTYSGRININRDNVNSLREVAENLQLVSLQNLCREFWRKGVSENKIYNYSLYLQNGLQKLWKEGSMCDVVLCVDGVELACHRVVLSAASTYFRAMFSHPTMEQASKFVTLQAVEPGVIDTLVNFAYTSRIDISEENVQCLLESSVFFGFSHVIDICSDYVQKQLHCSNCIGVLHLAQSLARDDLRQAAWDYITKNFTAASLCDEFADLDVASLKELLSADLHINTEEEVFHALMRWIRHDVAARTQHVPKLITSIRFAYLSAEFISNVVCRDALLEDTDLDPFIEESHLYQRANIKERLELESRHPQMHPRVFTEVILMICKYKQEVYHQVIYVLDTETGDWSLLTEFPHAEHEQIVTGATIGHDVIFCTTNTGHSWMYQISTDQWMAKAPSLHTHEANVGHKSVTIHGDVYVPGVARGCRSMEKYDPVSDTWSEATPMLTAVCYHALAVCQGNLFVLGGMGNGGALTRRVQMFEGDKNTWMQKSSTPIKTSHAAAASLGNKIYLLGNQEESMDTVYQYDCYSNRWKEVASLKESRQRCVAVACNGKAYAIGGLKAPVWKGMLRSIEEYDPEKNAWKVTTHLPGAFWIQTALVLRKYSVIDKLHPL